MPKTAALSRPAPAQPGLQKIGDLITGYRAARVLFAGATLGVFETLGRGELPLGAIQRRIGAREKPLEVLLDSLCSIGFLSKNAGRYRIAPDAVELLGPGQKSLASNLRYQELLWGAWGDLSDVVRTGRVRRPLDVLLGSESPRFVREYIRGMYGIGQAPAREVAEHLAAFSPSSMLDVGCGPGTFSIALLNARPELTATLLDLPQTLAVSRRFVADARLGRRVAYAPGSYHSANFGRGNYDLVLMSHITHDEGPEDVERLFVKARKALKPGGVLAVHDFMLQDDRVHPPFSALFSAHMLVSTRNGRVYTEGEYRTFYERCGFKAVRRYMICQGAPNATILLTGVC